MKHVNQKSWKTLSDCAKKTIFTHVFPGKYIPEDLLKKTNVGKSDWWDDIHKMAFYDEETKLVTIKAKWEFNAEDCVCTSCAETPAETECETECETEEATL